MRIFITLAALITLSYSYTACKSSSPKTFCDTTCNNDSLKFIGTHSLNPYIFISFKNCDADTVTWSYKGMGVNRKMAFREMVGEGIKLNESHIRSVFNDTSYAWLLFNDCNYGRGFYLKIPFNKSSTIGRSGRAINNLDPKYSIDDSLVAYTDRGNIFIEDMMTGKKAMMTFGKELDIDLDDLHAIIDSVNITKQRIWVKVKIDDEWKDLEKSITLQ
jgi:hypothetical protein